MFYLTLNGLFGSFTNRHTMCQHYVYSNQKSLFSRNSDVTTLLLQEEVTASFCIFF